jgi:hypothetical protein
MPTLMERLPTMLWNTRPRSRGTDAHDHWNAHIELPDCIEAGIHGHVPAPEYADVLVRIWALHEQGRADEARALYARVLPLATFVLQSIESLTTELDNAPDDVT